MSTKNFELQKEYDLTRAQHGPIVPSSAGKTRITIRIDKDVLDWFRQSVHEMGGGNYQTLINDALRRYIQDQKEPLEETLRRVLREELPPAQAS